MKPTRLGTASFLLCLVVAAIALAERAGVAVPRPIGVGSALAAMVLTALTAVSAIGRVWRGPPIEEFPCEDAAWCPPEDAERIREAAQLRGTLGGAGTIHRERLAFPALGWWGVAGLCAARVDAALAGAAPWMILVIAFAVVGVVLFPVQTFYYRELSNGGVAVYPSTVPMMLRALRREAGSAEVAKGHGAARGTSAQG